MLFFYPFQRGELSFLPAFLLQAISISAQITTLFSFASLHYRSLNRLFIIISLSPFFLLFQATASPFSLLSPKTALRISVAVSSTLQAELKQTDKRSDITKLFS